MAVKTLEQAIAANKHATGFDYLRLLFSILIIVRHTTLTVYGRAVESGTWTGDMRPYYQFLVPLFFALSGFLVAGSLARTNHLPAFLTLRVLRIFPALGGEVLISALLIGPLLTELPLKEYFYNIQFAQYFLNILGDIHYILPGMFNHNKLNLVNVQLWTVPYDLECYAILAVLAFVRLVRHPLLFALATILFTAVGFYDDLSHGRLILDSRTPGHMASATFLWGIFLYLYRHKIPYSALLCCVAVLIAWPALRYAKTVYLAPLPIAYITVYFGLMSPKKIFLINSRDFSYSLYLYGFPVQQAVYQLLPGCRVWYYHLPISLFISFIFAYLSWTYLESRIMASKKQALAFVNAWCARLERIASPKPAMPIAGVPAVH